MKDVSLDIYTGKLPAPQSEQVSREAVRGTAPKNVSDRLFRFTQS